VTSRTCKAPGPWQGIACQRLQDHFDDHAATHPLHGTFVWTQDTAERYLPVATWTTDQGAC
jgi:hypothetical protein